uniref:TRAF-type domain-containing protein n=1 Tax=Macrostomum lignano TaxID=282301 RepID=A0A1I8HAB1_9PLAT
MGDRGICGLKVGKLKQVQNRLKCPKCKHLMRSPVQAVCGHRYCADAITDEGMDCIACKEEDEDDVPHLTRSSVNPDPAMSRELNKTKFNCRWQPCPEKMLLPDLIKHMESDCQHREIHCDQCNTQLPASAMDKHLKSQCPKRRVMCESCKESRSTKIEIRSFCISCLARIRDTDEARRKHALTDCPVGWSDGQPCPFGCGPVSNAEEHRQEYVALHTDRLLAKAKSRAVQCSEGQEVGDSVAVGLEPSASNVSTSQIEMKIVEDVFDKAELVYNLEKFGYPEHPKQTSDPRGQAEFFERMRFSRIASDELDKQRDVMSKKLVVTYRAMEPLMAQMQRQYEELSAGDAVYKELLCAMSLKRLSTTSAIVSDCQRLSAIVNDFSDCQRLSAIVNDCQRLSTTSAIVNDCQRLTAIVSNFSDYKCSRLVFGIKTAPTTPTGAGHVIQAESCCPSLSSTPRCSLCRDRSGGVKPEVSSRKYFNCMLSDAGEVRICDLDRSISLHEVGSSDGTLIWKIPFFKERTTSTDYEPVLYSPLLFTDKFGYKLSAVVYLNGQGRGRGSHISLFARINKGPYDAALTWPFKNKVSFTLMNQSSPSDHLTRHYVPDGSSQFQRPTQPTGQLFGFEQFCPKDDLEPKGFLKDDTLFVKVQVAKSPLF